jgi:hypothetical protein
MPIFLRLNSRPDHIQTDADLVTPHLQAFWQTDAVLSFRN